MRFSSDYLSTSMVHLEEANSRIVDVDVAEETTNMAKYNLQVYAAEVLLSFNQSKHEHCFGSP